MRRPLLLLLAVSLAFNLAVAIAVGARLLPGAREEMPCAMPGAEHPEVVAACSRMQCRMRELHGRQAEETRRLAELLAAGEPDRGAIDRCVAKLGELQLETQRLVVDTLLEQMAALPPDARGELREHVRGRLCAPWGGCGMAASGEQPAGQPDPHQQGGRE
jgi:hypothetical protein